MQGGALLQLGIARQVRGQVAAQGVAHAAQGDQQALLAGEALLGELPQVLAQAGGHPQLQLLAELLLHRVEGMVGVPQGGYVVDVGEHGPDQVEERAEVAVAHEGRGLDLDRGLAHQVHEAVPARAAQGGRGREAEHAVRGTEGLLHVRPPGRAQVVGLVQHDQRVLGEAVVAGVGVHADRRS